jgi:hypothetical protein
MLSFRIGRIQITFPGGDSLSGTSRRFPQWGSASILFVPEYIQRSNRTVSQGETQFPRSRRGAVKRHISGVSRHIGREKKRRTEEKFPDSSFSRKGFLFLSENAAPNSLSVKMPGGIPFLFQRFYSRRKFTRHVRVCQTSSTSRSG